MMCPEIVQRLRDLNRDFYDHVAPSFAQSRARPQPGFYPLAEAWPTGCHRLLDVGCGDGRFGRFLYARRKINWYVGVDISQELLAIAQAITMGDFHVRDMSQPDFLAGLGEFSAISCLAAMQHIPGQANRAQFLQELADHLSDDGQIILSNWQFLNSDRQRRKIRSWDTIGLTDADVEPNDYLLTWQRDGFGLRYVCMIDEAATAVLAQATGLKIKTQFYSDGREKNLSLYTVLTK